MTTEPNKVNSTPVFGFAVDQKPKATRLSFGEQLVKLGELDKRVVVLDADLSKSTRTDLFAEKFPKRFFNVGIAEANLIGMAAGLANSGKIVFGASFGCFLTGRFDQIRMSIAFAGANVRLVGTHAGVGIGEDGHSQMALEDLALMRVLPGMTVFQPADDVDTKEFMTWSLTHKGPCYLRLTRQNLPALERPKDFSFEVGKWARLVDFAGDSKAVLIATGGLVGPALQAAHHLNEVHKLKIGVINANWIRPADDEVIHEILKRKVPLIVSLEDHYIQAGLGGVVAEVMASSRFNQGTRLYRIGMNEFGQSGTPEENYLRYGFTSRAICEALVKELKD